VRAGWFELSRCIGNAEEPTPEHLPYWRMKASKSAMTEIITGLALAIALGATGYYGYLAWLLVSPD
jgi:hypothetical protein